MLIVSIAWLLPIKRDSARTVSRPALSSCAWQDELCEIIPLRDFEYAPDFVTIDSADGGTGAAPQSLIEYMGMPIRCSLSLVVDKLVEYNLKGRTKVITSRKLINTADGAWALSRDSDFMASVRGFMFPQPVVRPEYETIPAMQVLIDHADLNRALTPG